jgi:glucose/arabinose dehydrogenase
MTACGGGGLPFDLKFEVVAPTDRATVMAFTPDGRLFFGEQFTGNIRVVSAEGLLQEGPFAKLDVANWLDQDWGLTGLAIDPDFETNHYIYAFFSELVKPSDTAPTARPMIARFTEKNGRGTQETIISDDFPETPAEHSGFNANGHIHFGPDGFLYVSVGDYDTIERGDAQDLSSPIGKLLRIDKKDGTAARGNPYADDPSADARVFAHGFRDPFDFAFHPENDAIYGTDNTTGTCEELNIIVKGEDYGWPAGEFPYSDCAAGDGVDAIYHFAKEGMQPSDHLSFVEVSGLAFLPGDRYPLLGDSLLVCELRSKVLRRLVLGGTRFNEVSASDVLVTDCTRDVAVSPDGTIYYSTDTEIRRLVTEISGE